MTLPTEHDLFNYTKQWVCLQCGYNMIGAIPEVCRFFVAHHDQFLPWDEAENKFQVTEYSISNVVTQLLSVPKLGYEHTACDYVFLTDAGMSFNTYGQEQETIRQASRIHAVVKGKSLKTVCSYNYVADFTDWMPGLERLIRI